MTFTDEQIEELRKIGDLAYMEQRTIASPTRAIAERVAAPLEARIAELERQIELAQRLHAVEVRAKDNRIATLTTACGELLAIVRLQNGNLHDDINQIIANAQIALEEKDEEEPKTAPCPFCGHQAQGSLSAIDKQRYEWLRQQFRVTEAGPDGTYRPIFPDCLKPARTLDESIDLTRGAIRKEVK